VKITIVIPVHGDRGVLRRCISAACALDYDDYDVLVVGDRITEDARRVVHEFPIRLINNDGVGVSAARNTGVRHALSDVVLFIDSDIELPSNALTMISESFGQAEIDGVIGLISEKLPYNDFFSRYKNLWMYYSYSRLPELVTLFYTSCAAIKKDVFLLLGGFDENYRAPSVEDTDFGRKIGEAGINILCRKDLQVIHWKSYSFTEVLRVDFLRSAALLKHIIRQPVRRRKRRVGETSVPASYMASLPLAVVEAVGICGLAMTGHVFFFGIMAMAIVSIIGLNRGWLGYLHHRFGWLYLFRSCVFIHLELWLVMAGLVYGLGSYLKGERY